jgi:hypothetical protein
MDTLAGYPDNRGPFVARMRRMAGRRIVVLELTPGFQFGLLSPQEAGTFAKQVREAVLRWFGWCQFDVGGLDPYVRCTADVQRRLVRVDFLPASGVAQQGCLAANPEMLMALAEVLDHRAAAIGFPAV